MLGKPAKGLTRASSDNHGHADWLSMKEAKKLFPGPDPEFGGIVVGEAYRVDQDRVASRPFDPSNERSWGQGGAAPLLIDPCRSGSTHALVIAGSGGFKTTSVGVPTMLTWTGAAVVLDPSREIGPMVHKARARMGHRVVTLDPNDAGAGAFNVLDWIDTGSPLAESNVEAVVGWIAGESGQRERAASGAHFFKDSGKALIACVLADILWDETLSPREKSLRRLRQVLITPEDGLREVLQRINATSSSAMARDLAGTLMGLVAETFSGVYANAARDTRWLSTPAYADLVSGDTFEAHEITGGKLTVFVQIPLKTLQATPALGRVIIGALLNAAYEADGAVKGRILFLLDEVSRLGYMGVLEQARDAGRKYGITLLLLYQSLGQLVEQWGREGKQAWYDSTSWRLFAAIQDPETARELSSMCGEHGVMATSLGDSVNASGRVGGAYASNSSGRSENRSEIRRALDQAGRAAPGRPRRRSLRRPARRQTPALWPGDLFSPAGHARTSRGEPVSQNPGRRMNGDGAVERLLGGVFGVVVALALLGGLLLLFQAYAGVVLIGCVGVAGWRLWRALKPRAPFSAPRTLKAGRASGRCQRFSPNSTRSSDSPM